MARKTDPLVLLTEDNPRRPVDWRWRRAVHLHDRRRQSAGRFGDKDVCRCLQYLAEKRGGVDDDELVTHYPDVFEVDSIFTASATERWMIEALIMGDEPEDDIARSFGMSRKNLKLYESLCFDVRSRLKNAGIIQGKVLDTAVRGEFSMNDPDKWWKLLGYSGYQFGIGGALIKAFWDYNKLPDEIRQWFQTLLHENLLKRSASATACNYVNHDLATYLVSNYQVSEKSLRESGASSSGGTTEKLAGSQRTLLESIQLSVGRVSKPVTSRLEKRADQVIEEELVAAGITLIPRIGSDDAEKNG